MKRSIKRQAAFFLAVLLIATVGTLGLGVLRGIKKNQQAQYEAFLDQQARTASTYIYQAYAAAQEESSYGSLQDQRTFVGKQGRELARELGTISGMRVVLYDATGKRLGDSFPLQPETDIPQALKYALKNQSAYQTEGDTLHYFAPITSLDGLIGVIQFQYPLKQHRQFLSSIGWLFLQIGGMVLVISFIVGYLYYNRVAVSIGKLQQAVHKIQMGKYEDIPEIRRRDELGELRNGIVHMSRTIQSHIQELQDALEQLKSMEQQQKDFFANVTHEFKTPLTVLRAYADLLYAYPEDEMLLQEARENIRKEAQRLQEMVEDALDLAALEKYDMHAKVEPVDVKELLEEVCSTMDGKARKFNITLHRDISQAMVYGDRKLLLQVFTNLLDNAIKYNEPQGEIFVKSQTNQTQVQIWVKDTGIGIPEESRERIFEPFYRVDKGRSRETGGTGLGLALVKQLVEKHKGDIQLVDTKEKGATFRVTLPLL